MINGLLPPGKAVRHKEHGYEIPEYWIVTPEPAMLEIFGEPVEYPDEVREGVPPSYGLAASR